MNWTATLDPRSADLLGPSAAAQGANRASSFSQWRPPSSCSTTALVRLPVLRGGAPPEAFGTEHVRPQAKSPGRRVAGHLQSGETTSSAAAFLPGGTCRSTAVPGPTPFGTGVDYCR